MQDDSIQGVIFTSKQKIRFQNVPSTHGKVFWFIRHPKQYVKVVHKRIDQSQEYVATYSTLAPKKMLKDTTEKVNPKNLVLR